MVLSHPDPVIPADSRTRVDPHQNAGRGHTASSYRDNLDDIAMTNEKESRIVWHDLLTSDEVGCKLFYASVAGWHYITEHATDFAWGGGEQDFVLALREDEAGAGMIARCQESFRGWIPYVEVEDVDRAASLACEHGGAVIKPPFEVPGVGRNSLLLDPLGAYIGISLSRHSHPAPTRQFALEHYLTETGEFPVGFYRHLFGWNSLSDDLTEVSPKTIAFAGEPVAVCAADRSALNASAAWLPGIRVANLAEALGKVRSGKGSVLGPHTQNINKHNSALVRDPTGVLSYLIEA